MIRTLKTLMLGALSLAALSPSAFAADTLGKTAIKTLTKTDVQEQTVGADGVTLANVQSNNTTVGAGGGQQVLGGLVNSTLPTYTAANIAMPSIDLAGRSYVTTDSGTQLRTNAVQINGTAISATNAMPSQLTDGTTVYVGTKTGQLPTSLGQAAMAGSVSVVLASNQSTVPVSQGAPTGASTARAAPVNIANGATTTITCVGSLTASQPVKLYQVSVTSQAGGRCTIRYNNNGATTNWMDVMTSSSSPTVTKACPAGFCGLTAGATGTQAIEASCTNLDATNDFGCDVQYCSAASGC